MENLPILCNFAVETQLYEEMRTMKLRARLPLFLYALLTVIFLISCTKEKKDEDKEKLREVEMQYENTDSDFSDSAADEGKLDEIKVIESSDENELATRELKKCVTMHRDLVKKYKATGDAKYKDQAHLIEQKAAGIQEKLRKAEYQPKSGQITRTGDLFLDMEASIADLAN